jgi:hypothetical protein
MCFGDVIDNFHALSYIGISFQYLNDYEKTRDFDCFQMDKLVKLIGMLIDIIFSQRLVLCIAKKHRHLVSQNAKAPAQNQTYPLRHPASLTRSFIIPQFFLSLTCMLTLVRTPFECYYSFNIHASVNPLVPSSSGTSLPEMSLCYGSAISIGAGLCMLRGDIVLLVHSR